LTVEDTEYREGSPEPTKQVTTFTRVANGPSGSHAVSGDWKQAKLQSASENAMTVTLEDISNGLKESDPTGEDWEATFDGKPSPIRNDPDHTMVSLKRVDANTIVETDTTAGKTVAKVRWEISGDGKTLKYSSHDERTGKTYTGIAVKQ
jgi:hypothetical protein